jgi:hypothetical protein
MGRANVDWALSFGINQGLSETATGEDEFVRAVNIYHCNAQVTVARYVLNGSDMVPHAHFVRIEHQLRLDLAQQRIRARTHESGLAIAAC